MSSVSNKNVSDSLLKICPLELANILLDEFNELHQRYYNGDFRPSELSGGRFCEVAIRICEFACTDEYTVLGKALERFDLILKRLEQTSNAKTHDTFRIHIPRLLRFVYDLRNKRDVAHLANGVSPNIADSSIILSAAGWVMAEFVRIGHGCSLEDAQELVNSLVQRKVPLVWEENGIVRILAQGIPYSKQVLMVLRHFDPERVGDRKLFEWLEHSNFSAFQKKVLEPLHKAKMIDYRDGNARILPPGIKDIEDNMPQ